MPTSVWAVFASCEVAILASQPTHRTVDDKEFHFQRWVNERIRRAGFEVPTTGRNTSPDFPVEGIDESYEVKGITVGSRNDFDCNSALPSGNHRGKAILYVFGRYEGSAVGENPQVLDLVIAHGAFLNAGGGYQADNKSLRVLGSYGDVLLRDRKMYVAYTPYRLLTGLRERISHWCSQRPGPTGPTRDGSRSALSSALNTIESWLAITQTFPLTRLSRPLSQTPTGV